MYGGAQREQRLWYCAEGVEVDHCNYFKRQETVDKLVQGLTRQQGDTSGFETVQPKGVSRAAAEKPTDNPEKPCVILLPGIMGSHLAVDDDGDRKIDCSDRDCRNDPVCAPVAEICDNGIDDDGDRKVDCSDRDCRQDPACDSGGPGGDPEICDDGIDNDGDGKTDCADKKDCGKDPAC